MLIITLKRIILIILTGTFFCNAHPVKSENQGNFTLLSHKQDIEKKVDVAALFMEANKYYKQENYSEAALGYEMLIQSTVTNGKIYYNLGNCYFKMGRVGKAILSYRLAELYIPRDEDLKTNLSYARQLTKDKIESKQFLPFLREFCFWYSKLNLKELLIVFLIAHGLFWTLATIRLFWKKEYQNLVFLINLALVAVLGCSLALKLYNYKYNIDGVVLSKDITVRSGNGINNTALFQLHDGAEFKIIKQDKDWMKIELGDGKRGWVERKWVGKCQLDTFPSPDNE